MFETCLEIRKYFSPYLDGQCEPEALRSLRFHLTYCASCRGQLDRWQGDQADLGTLPRRRVSPELALQLRVLISQQLHRNLLGRLRVHLENFLEPLLLPASGGALTAIICFGLIMGSLVVPVTTGPDVPLQILTPPRIRSLAPIDFNTGDQSLVVVTNVDADGRVINYRVLSGERSPELMKRLDRMMYFSLFDPATTFGKPTDGQVVLALRRITVRG